MNEQEIKKGTITGIFWKFAERIGVQVVSLVISIILARILDPSDYSVVSVVAIFFTFANVLISGGLNSALIQKKDADDEDYSTVLHVSVILSIVIYAILFFTAPYIANLYQQEMLVTIIRIMGLSLPITAIKSIWCAYISSRLQFKKFFFATLGGTLVSAVVGIVMAVCGFGAWALVAQQMINTIVDTIILIAITRIHIVFRISFIKFKRLFSYGWKVLVSSLLGATYNEVVPLVIGVKYTPSDLSYYTKGRSFPNLISSTTTNTFSSVLFPALAKYQNEKDKLLNYTRWFIRLTSFVAFPLMLGFLAISDTFIVVVLTEKWLPASPYIKIFCITCMFDVIHVGNCETIKAMGKSGVFLVMEIIKKTGYFITIILFLFLTNTPQLLALAFIVCTVIAIVVNSIPNKKLIGYNFKDQIADLLPNFITAIITCGCVMALNLITMNVVIKLFVQIAVGIIVYIVLNLLIKNKSMVYVLDVIKKMRKKSDKTTTKEQAEEKVCENQIASNDSEEKE